MGKTVVHTQGNGSVFASTWKRLTRILKGEGLQGILRRVQDHLQTDFAYRDGYLVTCPIGADGVMPPNPLGMQVEQIYEETPGVLHELMQVYGPPYSEEMLLTRWRQQRLLGFLGRINGEPASCVWVNPAGAVVEFGKPVLHLGEDEAYFKDAWTKPEWRGKGLYPLTFALSGQILNREYGKKTALNFILTSNHSSLNAYRKLGGQRRGRIIHLKLFRRKFTILVRGRARDL